MSHPFTIEYMHEGKTSSSQMNRNIDRPNGNENESVGHHRETHSKQSTCIRERETATEICQTDQVGENPDGDLETIREEMDITIADEERLSFFKILKMAMRHRIKIFAEEVSIVGLSHLVKPSSYKVGFIIRKIVWTMLLLFGTGFMVFQIYDRISYYQSYPTVVNYRVAYNRSLRFPTVTICSEAMASKKVFISMGNKVNYFHKVTTFVNYFHYL